MGQNRQPCRWRRTPQRARAQAAGAGAGAGGGGGGGAGNTETKHPSFMPLPPPAVAVSSQVEAGSPYLGPASATSSQNPLRMGFASPQGTAKDTPLAD